MAKIIAILDGGDWYDASVDHLVLVTDRPISSLINEYPKRRNGEYISLSDWLVAEGYTRLPEDEELEEIEHP